MTSDDTSGETSGGTGGGTSADINGDTDNRRTGTTRGMGKHTPMDREAAARIQSTVAKHPNSDSAQDQWDRRAQSAADRHEHDSADDAD